MIYNATHYITYGGLDTMEASTHSWLVTICVFSIIIATLFIMSKYFRKFLLGAIVWTTILLTYHLSRWIGLSSSRGNTTPLKWCGYIIGFILISVIIGHFTQKIKKIREHKFFKKEEVETGG